MSIQAYREDLSIRYGTAGVEMLESIQRTIPRSELRFDEASREFTIRGTAAITKVALEIILRTQEAPHLILTVLDALDSEGNHKFTLQHVPFLASPRILRLFPDFLESPAQLPPPSINSPEDRMEVELPEPASLN